MKVDARSFGSLLANLAKDAVRTLAGTVAVFVLAGIVLAGVSYYFLRDQAGIFIVLGVLVVLFESVVAGVVLGARRALAIVAAHALGSLRLGRSLVGLVFERMLGVSAGQANRGNMAQRFERLPLAQAEERLNGAVRFLTGDAEKAGWLRRQVQTRLLEAVRKFTLARFRQEGAKYGGVNLLQVKEELERTADAVLIEKVRSGLQLWTVLLIVGLPLVVAGQTWLILYLLSER